MPAARGFHRQFKLMLVLKVRVIGKPACEFRAEHIRLPRSLRPRVPVNDRFNNGRVRQMRKSFR